MTIPPSSNASEPASAPPPLRQTPNNQTAPHLLPPDRGRNEELNLDHSKPDRRISRIRLSSQWAVSEAGVLTPDGGSGDQPKWRKEEMDRLPSSIPLASFPGMRLIRTPTLLPCLA